MFPGLGGMDPRKMKQMMQQLGIKTEEIAAKKVIFELDDGSRLVFDKPQISAINMGGQKTYTVIGTPKTEKGEVGIPQDDIDMVASSAKVSKEKAKSALEQTNGDIAQAISKLLG